MSKKPSKLFWKLQHRLDRIYELGVEDIDLQKYIKNYLSGGKSLPKSK